MDNIVNSCENITKNPFTNEDILIEPFVDKSINGSKEFLDCIEVLRKIQKNIGDKDFKLKAFWLLRIVLSYNEYKIITKQYILPDPFFRYDTIKDKEDIPIMVDGLNKIYSNMSLFTYLFSRLNGSEIRSS